MATICPADFRYQKSTFITPYEDVVQGYIQVIFYVELGICRADQPERYFRKNALREGYKLVTF